MGIEKKSYVERVLIVLNEDGTIRGASQYTLSQIVDTATTPPTALAAPVQGDAESLTATTLADVLPSVSALVAQVAVLQADNKDLADKLSVAETKIATTAPTETPLPNLGLLDGADFLARLTDAEYSAILAAASQSVQLARWLDTFRLRGEIDVYGKTALAAKAGLIKAGLLTPERADVIFTAG